MKHIGTTATRPGILGPHKTPTDTHTVTCNKFFAATQTTTFQTAPGSNVSIEPVLLGSLCTLSKMSTCAIPSGRKGGSVSFMDNLRLGFTPGLLNLMEEEQRCRSNIKPPNMEGLNTLELFIYFSYSTTVNWRIDASRVWGIALLELLELENQNM